MANIPENSHHTPEGAADFKQTRARAIVPIDTSSLIFLGDDPKFPRVDVSKRVRYSEAVQRFQTIQDVDRRMQIGLGKNPEEIEKQLTNRQQAFDKLSLADQKGFLQDARGRTTEALNSLFKENLCLYDGLLIEINGRSNEEIMGIFNAKKRAFDSANLPRKLDLTLKMKSEAEDMLLKRFDVYVAAWRNVLVKMGRPQEAIDQEIDTLEDRFLSASPRGQIGITKSLRERISDVSYSRFSAFLELYSLQVEQKGLSGDDFPSPEAVNERYQGLSIAKRDALVDEIHKLTIRALTAKPVNFPSA